MSIEFGILRDGSTNAFVGELRATPDENTFDALIPLWRQIERSTGESLDKYESATFKGNSLVLLIGALDSHLCAAGEASRDSRLFVAELLRIARAAQGMGKPISYFGL